LGGGVGCGVWWGGGGFGVGGGGSRAREGGGGRLLVVVQPKGIGRVKWSSSFVRFKPKKKDIVHQ